MPWLMQWSGSSSCRPSSLSPLFVDGDIDVGTAYFISDSSLALSIDTLAKKVRWMGRVESSSRPGPSDQEE
jgi:hypothetical protein